MITYEKGGPLDKSRPQNADHADNQDTGSLALCATSATACTLRLACDPALCASERLLTPTGSAPAEHRQRRSIPANARTTDQARAAVARRWSATARRNEAFRILRSLELTAADRAELLALACGRGAR